MTNPTLIIFDCDGVLIDSEVIFYEAYAGAFREHGCSISASELAERFSGLSGEAITAELGNEIGNRLPDTFHADVAFNILERYKTGVPAIPGAAKVLSHLTMRRCVASSAAPTKLALGLIQAGLFDLLYPHIFSSSLVKHPKPSPDIFLFAAKQMKVSARECLVVEDSVAGIIAAKSSGMTAWGFVGGSHSSNKATDQMLAAGADCIISDLSFLLTQFNGS
jgi:HAD superfamily hydrolase (TIGR01509 family)